MMAVFVVAVELVDAASTGPLLELAGERSVNVLELNLALDREAPLR